MEIKQFKKITISYKYGSDIYEINVYEDEVEKIVSKYEKLGYSLFEKWVDGKKIKNPIESIKVSEPFPSYSDTGVIQYEKYSRRLPLDEYFRQLLEDERKERYRQWKKEQTNNML